MDDASDAITVVIDRLFELVRLSCEVLVVVDDASDSTVPAVEAYERKEPRIRCLINTYGPGPANAIRFGIDAAAAPVAVVTMADGCDDARQIDDLVRLVERGVAVAAASRYMPGGQQVGGPVLKGPCRHPGRDQLVQGVLHGLRPGGRHRLAGRLRDRHRADGQGQEAGAPCRRASDHLAGPAGGHLELQDRSLDSKLSALVPVRVRAAPDGRADPRPLGR